MNDLDFMPDPDSYFENIDLDCFDDVRSVSEAREEESRYIRPRIKAVKESRILYEHAVELAKSIDLERGVRYDVVVSGNFIFGDFIEAFLVRNNCKAIRMDITTLSLGQENVDSLRTLITKEYVEKLNLVISSYFYAHELHSLVPYIYEQLDVENRFQMAIAGTHMKTCLIETLGGKKIVLHGSANLRSSGNVEQFTIEENPELYAFYLNISDNILKEYSTIRKEIRGERLFNVVNNV